MGTNIQELPALSSTEIYYTVDSSGVSSTAASSGTTAASTTGAAQGSARTSTVAFADTSAASGLTWTFAALLCAALGF